jgi:hypothetical protein
MTDSSTVGPELDAAMRLITEVASSTLETVPKQPDYEQMIDRLGQAMGLLSQLAYSVLDLQRPGDPYRAIFERSYDVGRATAVGLVGVAEEQAGR